MNTRSPTFAWILVALPAAALAAACGGGGSGGSTDPSASSGNAASGSSSGGSSGSSGSSGGSTSSSGGSTSSSGGSTSSSGGSTSSSGGSTSSGDSGGPSIDAFTGAPPYVAQIGQSSHNAGQPCADCHEHTGFLVGGTAYKDMAGTIAAPGVEIRVRDATGKAVSTYSGSNGTFYMGGQGLKAPYLVGARDATTTRPMVTPLSSSLPGQSGSACGTASCHTGAYANGPLFGGTGYWAVHVP